MSDKTVNITEAKMEALKAIKAKTGTPVQFMVDQAIDAFLKKEAKK